MKKMLALLLTSAMTLFLVACGAAKPTESAAASAAPQSVGAVGMTVPNISNPFFVTLTKGAEAEAADLGVDLTILDAGDDADKQAADIQELLSKGIDVLVVDPVDADAVIPSVEAALEKGVKVIALDRRVNGVAVDCTISSDNLNGAAMATEYIINTLGRDSKVAEIAGPAATSSTAERGAGFRNTAENTLEVVASESGDFTRESGKAAMEVILAAHPDVQAVFSYNDEMALGAIEAAAGKNIMIVGFDAIDDAVAAVKEGTLAATVAQRPELMGATSVETAYKLIIGKSILKDIPVDVYLVNAENVG